MTGALRAASVVLMVLGGGGAAALAQQAEPAGAARVFPAADPAGDAGLVIRVSGQTVRGDGRESAGGYSVPADPAFGTHERALSIMPGGCGVSSAPYVVNEAVGGWYIWVTPVTVEGNRVTFRLIWERSPNGNTIRGIRGPRRRSRSRSASRSRSTSCRPRRSAGPRPRAVRLPRSCGSRWPVPFPRNATVVSSQRNCGWWNDAATAPNARRSRPCADRSISR
jgi:hypothetical protein